MVATSKPKVTAVKILEHFGMAAYFDRIFGAPLDNQEGAKKVNVIRNALSWANSAWDGWDYSGPAVSGHGVFRLGDGTAHHDVVGAGLPGLGGGGDPDLVAHVAVSEADARRHGNEAAPAGVKARGHKIFLDLKLHDIPNTVKKAMAVLTDLDVDMVNLHAAGTRAMMEAALEGVTRPDGTRPLVIAVTQLTSTSQERMASDLLIERPLDQVVLHYAKCAAQAGACAPPRRSGPGSPGPSPGSRSPVR